MPDSMINIFILQNRKISVSSYTQDMIIQSENLCCRGCNHIIKQFHILKTGHPQQVTCQKGNLQHITFAIRIVRICNIILPQTNVKPCTKQIFYPQM